MEFQCWTLVCESICPTIWWCNELSHLRPLTWSWLLNEKSITGYSGLSIHRWLIDGSIKLRCISLECLERWNARINIWIKGSFAQSPLPIELGGDIVWNHSFIVMVDHKYWPSCINGSTSRFGEWQCHRLLIVYHLKRRTRLCASKLRSCNLWVQDKCAFGSINKSFDRRSSDFENDFARVSA